VWLEVGCEAFSFNSSGIETLPKTKRSFRFPCDSVVICLSQSVATLQSSSVNAIIGARLCLYSTLRAARRSPLGERMYLKRLSLS